MYCILLNSLPDYFLLYWIVYYTSDYIMQYSIILLISFVCAITYISALSIMLYYMLDIRLYIVLLCMACGIIELHIRCYLIRYNTLIKSIQYYTIVYNSKDITATPCEVCRVSVFLRCEIVFLELSFVLLRFSLVIFDAHWLCLGLHCRILRNCHCS